ncbi:MAG TPA: tRNA-uridine aminocarboxypropyltransferase [Kofleriaceae bacterium]
MTCPRCLFQHCLCAEIPRLVNRTRVVVIRHHLEAHRSSNTARLAHLALENSTIVEHGGLTGPATLPDLSGAWLLYPLGEPTTEPPAALPEQLVVLYASWSQARRMYRKLPVIRRLPVLRLPDVGRVVTRMRESPEPGHVSTIEAIAAALRLLEGDAIATPLETLFDVAVARARATGRLNKP